MRIDLNADVGESFGAYSIGHDGGLMKVITSANIAAGFHGGDPSVLRDTRYGWRSSSGVAIGAHPGFPDLAGFGRRDMHVSATEAEDSRALSDRGGRRCGVAEGMRLQHVKPHGALFNMAARDAVLASAIARAVAAFDRQLILFGPPDSSSSRRAGGRPARRRRRLCRPRLRTRRLARLAAQSRSRDYTTSTPW